MRITLGGYIRVRDFRKQQEESYKAFVQERRENQEEQILKPIWQEKAFMNLPAVKLSISEEGVEGWRETLRKQQPEKPDPDEEKGILMYEGMISYSTMLHAKRTVSIDDRRSTLNDEAVDLVHAYGELYDEIVRGYETGERVAYVEDPEAEDGLRRVTLEEELAGLNEAFKRAVDSLESMHTYLQKMWKMNLKDMRLEHATGAEREQLLREKEEYDNRIQKKAVANTIPENTKEKLLSAVQEFIARYQSGNGGSISQIVANIKALSEFRK